MGDSNNYSPIPHSLFKNLVTDIKRATLVIVPQNNTFTHYTLVRNDMVPYTWIFKYAK